MRKIPILERSLLLFGLILVLLAILCLMNISQIASWVGLGSSGDRKVIAQVEQVQKVARRKTRDSADFTPLTERQSVFTGDVVATGPESKVVVLLQNGSYVVIDPNSAVEFQMVNNDGGFDRSIVLDVLKGKASGSGTNAPQIRVSKAPKALPPLPSATPTPSPAVVATPVPQCQFAMNSIDPPKEDGYPRAHINVKCSGLQKVAITVSNEQGQSESFELGNESAETEVFHFVPKRPGSYRIAAQQAEGELKFEVPRSFAIAHWSTEIPSCAGSLEGKAGSLPIAMSQVMNSGGKILWQQSGRNGFKTGPLANTVALPSDLSMKFVLNTGFEVTTPPLRLSQWRDCSFQMLPPEGRQFKFGVNRMILFTWSENQKAKYQFELASDLAFSKIIEKRTLEVNYFRMPVTRKGTFYWRVRTEGDLGPIETRSFTVQ